MLLDWVVAQGEGRGTTEHTRGGTGRTAAVDGGDATMTYYTGWWRREGEEAGVCKACAHVYGRARSLTIYCTMYSWSHSNNKRKKQLVNG